MRKCSKVIPIVLGIIGTLANCTNIYAATNLRTMYNGNVFAEPGQMIVNGIYWVGICVLVGAVIVKGIQYVSAAPDGKADIKKSLFMLVMGVFLITCAYGIILLIKNNAIVF